jgi:hypothetical protein
MIFSVAFLLKQGRFTAITSLLFAFKPYYFTYLLRRFDLEVHFQQKCLMTGHRSPAPAPCYVGNFSHCLSKFSAGFKRDVGGARSVSLSLSKGLYDWI